MVTEGSYRVHKSPSPVPIPNYVNTVYTLSPYFVCGFIDEDYVYVTSHRVGAPLLDDGNRARLRNLVDFKIFNC
jgi:hypothetical protein